MAGILTLSVETLKAVSLSKWVGLFTVLSFLHKDCMFKVKIGTMLCFLLTTSKKLAQC